MTGSAFFLLPLSLELAELFFVKLFTGKFPESLRKEISLWIARKVE